MAKPKIIILYKDKSYKLIKENEFYKEMKSNKSIRCLLFPSLTNNLVYYPVLPDKCLLSNEFKIDITFDIGQFDFDEDTMTFIDRFTSHYETTSVLQFINYISIFYKINGCAEIFESAFLGDGYTIVSTIYPIHYNISFGYGNEKYNIDSGILRNSIKDNYLPDTAFRWITDGRMDSISHILFTSDFGENSFYNLPLLIALRNENWFQTKYANKITYLNLNPDDIILIKINGFNSYYLSTYKMYCKMTHTNTFVMDVFISPEEMLQDPLYLDYAYRYQSINQNDRDALCRYIKEEYEYVFGYTFSLGDAYCFITWIAFNYDIINYLTALYKKQFPISLITIRHLGKLVNTSFSYEDIKNGKFTAFLYEYITRRNN